MPVYDYICDHCKKSFETVSSPWRSTTKNGSLARTAAARMWSRKWLRSLP